MTAADATGTYENPVTGERIDVREHVPGLLRFDYRLEPGGFAIGRLDHVHPHQVEQVRVRAGRLGVRAEDGEWTATAGDQFTIPASTAHTLWNDGTEPVHATVELRPALDAAAFFRTTFGLAREGGTNELGLPGPLQLAVLLDEYGDQMHFASVPRSLQLGVAAMLAPLGRLLGYRARYPRFEHAATRDDADAAPERR